MRTQLVITALMMASVAYARGPRFYQKGTLIEMNSVECGYEEKGAKGVSGVFLGTDAQHRKTREMLCQEYMLRTDRLVYRIRPKEEKHPMLLPVGDEAEFRVDKDHIRLRVPEADGKEREYYVVSMVPRSEVSAQSKPVVAAAPTPK